MLDETVKDYAAYIKLDVSDELKSVQDVVDNMLTRLEELNSVLNIIKSKNTECASTASIDISKYRGEITLLSRKIMTLYEVMRKSQNNIDTLEKQIEKAEVDFGINQDSKLRNFLKPFLKKSASAETTINQPLEKIQLQSVMDHFEESE